jgi:hypothetical protein
VKANTRKKKKPQKKNAPIGYEKSKDVGHVESNTLAKGQPFVCLKIIFWQTSSV